MTAAEGAAAHHQGASEARVVGNQPHEFEIGSVRALDTAARDGEQAVRRQSFGQDAPERVVDVHHGHRSILGEPGFEEQSALGGEVRVDGAVIVEMVLRQVGEGHRRERDARRPDPDRGRATRPPSPPPDRPRRP